MALRRGGYPSNELAEHGAIAAAETSTCRRHGMALADVVMTEPAAALDLPPTEGAGPWGVARRRGLRTTDPW
ncbi:hypothetical protein ACIRPR_02640 [Streptomyces griseoflavus]|uniref:hypothetical protein n=1 Tax=Streptomyces griseoflavus TaxID=35619 RepID=UPI0037FE297A